MLTIALLVRMRGWVVFLLPVDFVPFFGMALGAALRSLSYGRVLHTPFFEAKRMSPLQIELWITERQLAYRSFGFVAALMERIPLIGLIFSISNRIGAAMWAHDLEKRQQLFSSRPSTSTTTGNSTSTQPKPELEEYHKPVTLKKIYKNVRDDVDLPAAEEEGGFNGEGCAVVRFPGEPGKGAVLTMCSFTFPLKLLVPREAARNATLAITRQQQQGQVKAVSAIYVVGYGGGLVSGDSVSLDVDVGSRCTALVLTQGSTKVFKTRNSAPTTTVSTATYASAQQTAVATTGVTAGTKQVYRFLVRPNSTLILLPDPVTCFAEARYDQVQRFDLRDRTTSSLVVLDWITSGRHSVPPASSRSAPKLDHLDSHSSNLPRRSMLKDYTPATRTAELWSFSSYRSRNEVRLPSVGVVARDVLLLEGDDLATRCSPYGCYATLLLAGPDANETITRLEDEFERIQQRLTTHLPEPVLWSMSQVEGAVRVVRIAGENAEAVKAWLYARLSALQGVVGRDLYRQALG